MFFNIKNAAGKKVKVIDAMGREIKYVQSYDTATRNAVILVPNGTVNENGKPNFITTQKDGINTILKTKVTLRGSKIIVDGKTY